MRKEESAKRVALGVLVGSEDFKDGLTLRQLQLISAQIEEKDAQYTYQVKSSPRYFVVVTISNKKITAYASHLPVDVVFSKGEKK